MTAARAYLAGIKERAEKATAGPWHLDRDEPGEVASVVAYARNDGITVGTYIADVVEEDGDAAFIAHSRTDLPRVADALLAVLDFEPQSRSEDGEIWRDRYADGCNDMLAAIRASISAALRASL